MRHILMGLLTSALAVAACLPASAFATPPVPSALETAQDEGPEDKSKGCESCQTLCQVVCQEVCTSDCRIVNGEEVCTKSCETICPEVCNVVCTNVCDK